MVIWIAIGVVVGCVTAASGTRPREGRSAAVPHIWLGTRSEPPRSLPRPRGGIPVASAAASAPVDPPGERVVSQGFRVRPARPTHRIPAKGEFRQVRSGKRDRPGFAQAGDLRCIAAGDLIHERRDARVVAEPATSIFSLIEKGTPASGPSLSPEERPNHIQSLYTKIGVSTRAGAALYALEHGLVEEKRSAA